MSVGTRIKSAREGAGLSQSALARSLGLTRNAVSLWENNKNEPSAAMLRKVADALDVKWAWLASGDGPRQEEPAAIAVPEIDVRAGAGGGGVAATDYMRDEEGNTYETDAVKDRWGIPVSYMRNELHVQPSAVRIIEILGDSMAPTLRSGDRVMVDESHRTPSPPGIYALHDGYGVIVKRIELIHGSEPAAIRILSDNPNHTPYELTLDEANVIGRVVWRASPL